MENEERKPGYYAVIPATVRYDKRLSSKSKLLYGEIAALANAQGCCWAKSEYFARIYDVDTSSVRRWISALSAAGYILVDYKYVGVSREIEQRLIYVADIPRQNEIMSVRSAKPGYYAIIPATVRYDNKLSDQSKLMYGEITSLADDKGCCDAKNDYFAQIYEVSDSTVRRWISSLSTAGYIRPEFKYVGVSREIEQRLLFIEDMPARQITEMPQSVAVDAVATALPAKAAVAPQTAKTDTSLTSPPCLPNAPTEGQRSEIRGVRKNKHTSGLFEWLKRVILRLKRGVRKSKHTCVQN